jgi:hypothetical protein
LFTEVLVDTGNPVTLLTGGLNWNLEALIFVKGGNLENPEKKKMLGVRERGIN